MDSQTTAKTKKSIDLIILDVLRDRIEAAKRSKKNPEELMLYSGQVHVNGKGGLVKVK